jgi:hypothetical protein
MPGKEKKGKRRIWGNGGKPQLAGKEGRTEVPKEETKIGGRREAVRERANINAIKRRRKHRKGRKEESTEKRTLFLCNGQLI